MCAKEEKMFSPKSPTERLIVALDYSNREQAIQTVEKLAGKVGMFKIGMQLNTVEGPAITREIVAAGERVFLDLKFHDIPNTVEGAAASASTLGVSMFNVHTLGGEEMMGAAMVGVNGALQDNQALKMPLVIGVTILTSMDQRSLERIGINIALESEVVWLAKLAHGAGLHGVVASPKEILLIRDGIEDEQFIIVTPGIRFADGDAHDQKRIATPFSAIYDGADYIVVGRAITDAPDPAAAADRAAQEIADAMAKRGRV